MYSFSQYPQSVLGSSRNKEVVSTQPDEFQQGEFRLLDPAAEEARISAALSSADANSAEGAAEMVELAKDLKLLTSDPERYLSARNAFEAFKSFNFEHHDQALVQLLFSEMLHCREGFELVEQAAYKHDELEVRLTAIRSLKNDTRSTDCLLELLGDSQERIAIDACRALQGREEAVPRLMGIIESLTIYDAFYYEAFNALNGSDDGIKALIDLCAGPDPQTAILEIKLLKEFSTAAIPSLLQALHHPFLFAGKAAAETLQKVEECLPELLQLISDEDGDLSDLAAIALKGKEKASEQLLEKFKYAAAAGDEEEVLLCLQSFDGIKNCTKVQNILQIYLRIGTAEQKAAAAKGLGGIPGANGQLQQRLGQEKDIAVRSQIIQSLLENGEAPEKLAPVATELVQLDALSPENSYTDFSGLASAFASRLDEGSKDVFRKGLQSEQGSLALFCIEALKQDPSSAAALIEAYQTQKENSSSIALALRGRQEALHVLLPDLYETDEGLQTAIVHALSPLAEAEEQLIHCFVRHAGPQVDSSPLGSVTLLEELRTALQGRPEMGTKLAKALTEIRKADA